MSVKFMRKTVVAVAATALLSGGLAVGVGQGAAGAEPGCEATAQQFRDPTIALGPLKHGYTYDKKVSPTDPAPGGTVTVTTQISSQEGWPLVYDVIETPPPGFVAVDGYVTAKQAIDILGSRNKVTVAQEPDGRYRVSNGAGWSVFSGDPLVVEIVYRVPDDVRAGDVFQTGGTQVNGTLKIDASMDLQVCGKIRPKNALESAGDAAGSLGVSPDVFGSLSDPQGSVAGVVGRLDMGGIVGGIIGDMF